MSFRTEEKIVLTSSDQAQLKAQLDARGMKPLYPKRRIQSIYLETPELAMFRDSEEGVLPRRKVRLRYYDDEGLAASRLETKISSVEGRFKTTSTPEPSQLKKISDFGFFDRQYGLIYPQLLVSYDRRYYMLDGLRLTFDTDICYARPDGTHMARDSWTVCEIKASIDTPPDRLLRLVDVSRRRFSKFCNGVDAVIRHANQTPGLFDANRLT